MFPFEVDYFARKERSKDLQREAACDQLLHEAGLETGAWDGPRKVAHWVGGQLVKLGSKLEDI